MPVRRVTRFLRTHRRYPALGLSVGLSAATLYFVFRGIDGRMLHRLIATQNRSLLAAAAFLVVLQFIFGGERWRAILSASMRGAPPSVLDVQLVFYSSLFFNWLPLGTIGGDVARVWLARRFAVSVSHLVMSVLFDRMLTVFALVMLAAATLPTLAHPLATTAWFGAVGVLAIGIAGFLLLAAVERMLGSWRHRRLAHLALRVAAELRYLTRHGGALALLWALLSGISSALAGYCISRSLGISVGPVAMIAFISIVTLIATLPISVAGWGVREASFVLILGFFGIDREAAVLLSVQFGLLNMLLSLPGGVVWLVMREHQDASLSAK